MGSAKNEKMCTKKIYLKEPYTLLTNRMRRLLGVNFLFTPLVFLDKSSADFALRTT